MDQSQSPPSSEGAANVWVCYLALGVVTLLIDAILVSQMQRIESEVYILITFSLMWAQNNLCALAAVAPRNNHRAWCFLFVPIASLLAGMAYAIGGRDQIDLDDMVMISAIFLISGGIVIAVLGPWRLWQAVRPQSQVGSADWRFGIRHFLVASAIVAVAASAVHLFGDEVRSAPWIKISLYVGNAAVVAIICGLLLQAKPLDWRRLATAVGLALAIGWCSNQVDDEFADYGGVRANAIHLAVIVPWLWLPTWWRQRMQPREID